MTPSNKTLFHSGKRLRQLREMQGLKTTELASALDVDYDNLLTWEDNGIPTEQMKIIQHYFNVTDYMFETNVDSPHELKLLAESQLFPQRHDIELQQRLTDNLKGKNPILNLSGLNLTVIPDAIFSYVWLENIDISNNHIEFMSTQLLLLTNLTQLNIKQNRLTHIPAFISDLPHIQLIHDNDVTNTPKRPQCIVILAEINQKNLTILDGFSKVLAQSHNVVITTIVNCEPLFSQCTRLSHVLYIGAHQLLQQLPAVAKTTDRPWICFADPTNQQTDKQLKQALAESISPRASVHIVTQEAFKPLFKQINYQDNIDTVKLTAIELHNIGVYQSIRVALNADLTVLIGVNGAGKSTVLKAIALGILGPRKSGFGSREAADLLRINGKAGKETLHQSHGKIIISALINEVEHHNTISLNYNTDTDMVDISGNHFAPLFNADGLLNHLILGIGEQRNTNTANQHPPSNDTKAKVRDLLPTLTGEAQSCISHFSSWLGNLALEVLNGDQQKQAVINTCFEVFSELMAEPICFKGFTRADPMELWVGLQNPPQTIPLRLTSQGYQAVMGWVGYIIQRMFEAYNECLQPFNQPAIIIIDEIDQLLSVKWQQKILTVLAKSFFPNSQWIVSSHSPMVVTELDRAQVVQLHIANGQLVAQANQVDLWMWQYGDIVRNLFEVPSQAPKFQEQALTQSIKSIEAMGTLTATGQTELNKLQLRLEKVRQSRAAVDELYNKQQQLHDREQQLAQLIAKLDTQQPEA